MGVEGGVANLFRDGMTGVVVHIGNSDLGAFARIDVRRFRPDAGSTARDQRHFTYKPSCHLLILSHPKPLLRTVEGRLASAVRGRVRTAPYCPKKTPSLKTVGTVLFSFESPPIGLPSLSTRSCFACFWKFGVPIRSMTRHSSSLVA